MDKADLEAIVFERLNEITDEDVQVTQEFQPDVEELPAVAFSVGTSPILSNRVSASSKVIYDENDEAESEESPEHRNAMITIGAIAVYDDDVVAMERAIVNEFGKYEADYDADPRDLHEDLHYMRVEDNDTDVVTATRHEGQDRMIQVLARYTRYYERDVDPIEDVVEQ